MDDGDIEILNELSDKAMLSNPESSSNFQTSTSMNDNNELLRNTRTCIHTHTCNPPGPDAARTHICYHTHTQVFASEDDHLRDKEHTNSKPRRPLGNREAVRKYREKKKAHTAYLEEEVKKLRLLNKQLVRKLQGLALLEAEVLRLRRILVDFKKNIDNELGVFPYKKQCISNTMFKERDAAMLSTGRTVGLQCQANLPCFHLQAEAPSQVHICGNGKLMVPWEGNCQSAIVDCRANEYKMASTEEQTVETVDNLVSSASQAE